MYSEESRMAVPRGFADVSVQLQHALLPRPAFITFGVDPTDTDPVTVAAKVDLAINAAGSLKSRFDNSVTIGPITARLGTDGSGDLVGISASTAPGGSGGSSVPPNVSVLVHKRSGMGGRRGRGRMYLPWWLQIADCDEKGAISPTSIGFMQTTVNTFLAALTTNSVPMVLLHNPGRSPSGPPTPVTNLTVDATVGTQRRRLGR
jgi:hypothetical protein